MKQKKLKKFLIECLKKTESKAETLAYYYSINPNDSGSKCEELDRGIIEGSLRTLDWIKSEEFLSEKKIKTLTSEIYANLTFESDIPTIRNWFKSLFTVNEPKE
jgi:hypothetical protein